MRGWLERKLHAIWYREQPAPLILRGLSQAYGWAARRRAIRNRRRAQHPGVPVIVVGNLCVGGSGKSPLVIWLAEQLSGAGWRPGVVSRGYGARPGTEPVLVDQRSRVTEVGDEALMIWRRCGVPVAVHPDRVRAARRLVASGIDVLISDDGLQHWRLQRDTEIVVIDGVRGHGNGQLIPAGPLREDLARLQQVDFVVSNGASRGELPAGQVPMRLVGSTLRRLDAADKTMALADLAGREIHALAGIGHPERFFAALTTAGLKVTPHRFADHHKFCAADLTRFHNRWLVMTEKDAVKCARFAAGQQWWYLPVAAELPAEFARAVLTQLEQLGVNRP